MSEEDTKDHSDEATEGETTIDAAVDAQDHVGDEWAPFDEIQDDFKPSVIMKTTAADGMPTNTFPEVQSDIPALSVESLVCMEDLSSFVVRGMHGDITERFEPEEVEQKPDGKYYVKDSEPSNRQGLKNVEPVRPRCQHYVRQMSMADYNPELKSHLRLCAARRTTEGTFMTLRDSAMWACSMREPRDLITEASLLDKFDKEKILQGKNRTYHKIFDVSDTPKDKKK